MSPKNTIFAAALMLVLVMLGAGCAKEVSFSKNVMPILEQHCLACHKPGGPGYETSGLSMESYQSLMKGTKFGSVTKPGYSGASTLVIMMEYEHDPVAMPRGSKPLAPEQLKLVKTWIDQGAKDN